MTTSEAVDELIGLLRTEDPLRDAPAAETLTRLQLAAADERFQAQRRRIAVLDHRAREFGLDRIESMDDLVPLLFTHSVYKSYPDSFVINGRWDRMNTWLDTVSDCGAAAVDVAGVIDVDAWIERLADAGVHLVASSGTSGKPSFLPMSVADVELTAEIAVAMFAYPHRPDLSERRPVTLLAPGRAHMRYSYSFRSYCAAFGRAGATTSLTDEPMLVADSIETSRLRRAMLDGSIIPSDLALLEQRDRERAERAEGWLQAVTERIHAQRDEPQVIIGPWATFWRVKEIAEAAGVGPGTFHPDTVVSVSGGLKGLTLPADHQEQLAAFFGSVVRPKFYGMSELSSAMPMCEEGAYHVPPWLALLVLDESGEKLAVPGPDGTLVGRAAFYDPVWDSRWGGLVSGDQIMVPPGECGCGRPGPRVEDSVRRFSDLAGDDDKLTCGGTIEQYIRGVTGP